MTNKTEAYMDAPWNLTFDAEATATHKYEFESLHYIVRVRMFAQV
jgi:hypothetical protein